MFLDDLQWLDAATLKLLESLVTKRERLPLLLVGAYRTNEVHPAHPLAAALDTIRKSGAPVNDVVLAALTPREVGQLVSDALRTSAARAESLAQLVCAKTAGNPYFTIEFLSELAHEKVLTFSASSQGWTWDTERILAKGYTNNVVDLMIGRISRLRPSTQDVLKQLACLGNRTRISTLELVRPDEGILETELWDALHSGVVLRSDDAYAFPHDRVQEAAYSLIPERLRAQAHLRIGRLLLASLPEGAPGESVFDVLSQLNRAVDLIDDPQERATLRRLNIRAGKRAKESIAFLNARDYLALAATLDPPEPWLTDYRETFELYLLRAECEFLVGRFDVADELFKVVLENAGSNVDRAAAHCVYLQLRQVAGRYEEGFLAALDALRLFDIVLPESDADIQAAMTVEYARVATLLGDRTIADVADAPRITDVSYRALMDLLVYAAPCAFIGSPRHFPLVTLLAVTLSLRHGNTDVSCRAYAAFAVMLVSMFEDIPAAYAFSEMALRLNEKLGKPRDRGSLLMMHGHMVAVWKQPLATCLPTQERAFSTCLEVGDLAYAGYLAFLGIWQRFENGDTLDGVLEEAAKFAAFARQTNNDAIYQTICLEQQFIASLQGTTDDPLGMQDASFDEAASIAVVSKATFGTGIAFYHVMKTVLAFHQGRFDEALRAADAAKPFVATIMALAIEATYHFYEGLATAALLSNAVADERQSLVQVVADKASKFARWAALCPATFDARHSLLLAEIARVEGRHLEAMDLYEAACRLGRMHGIARDEAMALELSGLFYEARGLETTARAHFRDARDRYARWGAKSKVRELEARRPYLREGGQSSSTPTIGAQVEHLDLATVVRVLQALSSEIILDKWIDVLMTLALEDAGARRGILLVPSDAGLRCLAEAVASTTSVAVRIPKSDEGAPALPRSVLSYVERTHKTVVLDNAAGASEYSADPYVVAKRSQSILCMPLVKRGELAGVLYLENELAPSVFVPHRTAVLRLVVAQAAVSLENARLYTDLQRENDARKRTEEALRRSEVYLAEAQRLSKTGSFGWHLESGRLVFSDETYRLLGFDRSSKPVLEDVLARVHPEDAASVRETLDRVTRAGEDLDAQHRFVMADGSVKFVHVLGRPVKNGSGPAEYVGAAMDITEQHHAEVALQHAQAELAHVMRVTALGELAASIAHEVNQPLAAISANGSAGLNWLGFDPPRVQNAREALVAIVADSERAGDIISRIRRLLSRCPSERTACDVNAIVSGVLPLVRSQFEREHVALDAEMRADVPTVLGDAVQLQQVVLNLLLNAADACRELGPERRRVAVRTSVEHGRGAAWVALVVTDTGKGIDPATAGRIFEAFYTTKPEGLGMGLSISRSIALRHGGQLTMAPNPDYGVTLSLRLPAQA
ncbi:Signal transduction histidine kinase CheA [Labilithrix luteola]|uniref:histidine kinase n=2 Tax=Labilithrix luteola TaxID=1391654 RepID=A0A0K1PL23_9BACT|nr:ATP-binding protein [Labilithrix luteola]AKU93819.1 Signal transduction histidine kinase CheA [Labilithrix luteola]